MTHSMTGFATQSGSDAFAEWQWDLRGVNAKGLDIRLRLPDGIEGLEQKTRSALAAAMGRGSINASLKLTRLAGADVLSVNQEHLSRVLMALDEIENKAVSMGLTLGQPTAADVLSQRGILENAAVEPYEGATIAAVLATLADVIESFLAMRRDEGGALNDVLSAQVDTIETLTEQATKAAEARTADAKDALVKAMARIIDNTDGIDADRLHQELALLAVKADITEEIDRLKAHVNATRALLDAQGPVGRKLDFLMQEFNREANTLCSKAGSTALTAIGLDLKAVIDQMREQVQNVE
ncbi:YicC/YloC family endoribonuclease [Thalassobium sp. R2A62]|uniref:YicC/YloC family endoribonuclease n=1 Tax=Thalassobium sp. R2A62 TaxID=633131 RepID=UPI0001B1CCD3|nr:YicC/YloC family endoribonuclease [Thalassobium sp. R2A62]EET46479.1 hypothetical protein TR2A62_0696 [Thalassobium sp. R2A62]